MGELDLFKKRRKAIDSGDSELFKELEIDVNSDHPVHERFVNEKRIREIKKKGKKGLIRE